MTPTEVGQDAANNPDDQEARQAIVEACRSLRPLGINQGTSGNISVRVGDTILVSPSATPYEAMRPDQIAESPIIDPPDWSGPLPPSTEWPMHMAIMRARPDVGAIVHAHPPHCTALAMTRQGIPACHYMIAVFGGDDVRCAPYATYGTPEFARTALTALEGRHACLLANHGMVVCSSSLSRAMWLAVELEALARQYVLSRSIGGPVLLTDRQVAETASKLSGYGMRLSRDDG